MTTGLGNTQGAGLQYSFGQYYNDGWNYRRVVDNDKKVYWIVSQNIPGGPLNGEGEWHWYDEKAKRWQPFEPIGYQSARQIAQSMKGADKALEYTFGAAFALPFAIEGGIAGLSVCSPIALQCYLVILHLRPCGRCSRKVCSGSP